MRLCSHLDIQKYPDIIFQLEKIVWEISANKRHILTETMSIELTALRTKIQRETCTMVDKICSIGKDGDFDAILHVLFAFKDSMMKTAEDWFSAIPLGVTKEILSYADISSQISLITTSKRFYSLRDWTISLWKSDCLKYWTSITRTMPISHLEWCFGHFETKSEPIRWAKILKHLSNPSRDGDSYSVDYTLSSSQERTEDNGKEIVAITIGTFADGELIGENGISINHDGVDTGSFLSNKDGIGYGTRMTKRSRYFGYFQNKQKQGQGTEFFRNGIQYKGEFELDERYGYGKF